MTAYSRRPAPAALPPGTQEEQPARAHTKIVATIGPASEERIDELVEAGMSVARINFSHGTHEDHRRRIAHVRSVADAKGIPVGILVDIQGPKLRLGLFEGGKLRLRRGERVRLIEGGGLAGPGEIPFNFPGFFDTLEPGHRVFLADGAVELVVEESSGTSLLARVRRGGEIGDRKGVHLPDTPLTFRVPTPQDLVDLAVARELDVDMVGVSFVARAEELRAIRAELPKALVVAKIERYQALENLEEILAEADGIMIARGDLGVEAELERLPMIQKALIQDALRAGKFTVTATEMLESMVSSSRPTRAEVADVANAVLDGSDAVMLSAETAIGTYPVEAVGAMTRIAGAVETSQRYHDLPRVAFRASEATFSNAIALAAAQAADALQIGKIVVFTETGNTARLLSRYRPSAEVIALSPHPRTVAHMTILAHVRPFLFPAHETLEDMLEQASEMLLARGLAVAGEQVVFVAGVPPGVARSTNVMKLHRIGDPVKLA